MNKHKSKQLFALLLAALLLQGSAALCAHARERETPVYTILAGETDAQGNLLPERIVDENGNTVVQDSPVRAAADDIPVSYDTRLLFDLTSIKNQAGSGSCWAFSTIACMETSLTKQGYGSAQTLDFSEAHLVWFGQNQRVADTTDPTWGDGRVYDKPFRYGGNWSISAPTILRGSGLQLESRAPWIESYDDDILMTMAQPESERYVSFARLWDAHSVRDMSDRDAMKRLIMQNGAAMTAYYDDTGITNTGYNASNKCYYQSAVTGISNHAVTIVGWNDSYPKEYFNEGNRPENDGAWIIKGSWGTWYGREGYYWLSYEDPSINSFASFRAAPADIYDHIYQYDGAYPSKVFPCSGQSASMANTFTAQRNEDLTHVVLYSPNVQADALVEVYAGDTSAVTGKDPTAGMTLVSEATTKRDGVLYGYSTVELASPVPLTAGQHFTVKVTLQTDTGTVNIPVEGTTLEEPANGQVTYGGNVGESFVCIAGAWSDTNQYGANAQDLNNVPVKAMTKDRTVEPTLEIGQMPDKTTYTLGETPDLAGLTLLYTDEQGAQITVTDGYSTDAALLDKVGTATITVTYRGLTCTLELSVQRTPGDVNGDGSVTLLDAAVLERFLAGGYGVTVWEANADVNADGGVSLLDAILLKRYVAGGYGVVLQ